MLKNPSSLSFLAKRGISQVPCFQSEIPRFARNDNVRKGFRSMRLKLELRPQPGFHFFRGHHLDGVPWAAIQKTSVGAFARALFAADTELRINLDATEGRVLLVNHPIHAI